jgi:ABC-type sugar transport system permease subunit/ABC-type glycerol-3-phosphate transport system substrate-binding protein
MSRPSTAHDRIPNRRSRPGDASLGLRPTRTAVRLGPRMKNLSATAGFRLRRLGLTGAVVFCAWLGGVAQGKEITLDIPVFDGGYGTAFYEQTARLFEAQRPGVKVNLYGDPRIEDRLRVRLMAGELPDATLAPRLPWPALIRAGKVRALDAALDAPNWENDARWGDTFLPGALASWRISGKTHGVPLSYACWGIFYDRALFRARGWTEPKTWDDFFALCEKIRASKIPAAGGGEVAPVAFTGVYGNYPDAFFRAAYYSLAGPEGWRALQELAPGARLDPRYARAAEVLRRITQNYGAKGWEGMTHTAAQLAFLDGRAAMVVSGSWMLNEMKGKIPAGLELGVMNFPVFPNGAGDPTAIQTGSDCFFAFATGDPERERLTVEFLRFLTSRARAEAFVRELDAPAAVRGVPAAAYSPRLAGTAAMIAAARDAFNMPQAALQPAAVRQALVDARLDLMMGKISPEKFGERLEAAADADRARAADPDRVAVRHPLAAAGLLLGLAGVAGCLGWAFCSRGRRPRTGLNEAGYNETHTGGQGGARPPGALETRRDAAFHPVTDAGDPAHLGPLRGRFGLMFVGPAFAIYAALVLLPGLVTLAWALLRWDGLDEPQFARLTNFKWLLLESDGFWSALGNNLFLVAVPAVTVLPLALALAGLIHRGAPGAGWLRVVLLFPNLLGGVAAALLWLNAYEPHGGLVNTALTRIGLHGFADYAWLAPDHLYLALVPIYLWLACGFNLVLYLAAMEGVPAELYEAAELEGASKARQFFTITLPLIRETVAVSAVFTVIGGLNAFELVWLLTSQDPGTATHTLGTLMVTAMFKDFDIGRATAVAAVMFALVLMASAALLRLTKREAIER